MKKAFFILFILAFTVVFALNADARQTESSSDDTSPPSSLIAHGLSLVFDAFSSSGKGVAAHCGGILALCVTAAILNSLKSAFPSLGAAAEYVSLLALSGAVFGAVSSVTKLVEQATLRFAEYLLTLLPVMTAMYVYGGNAGAAVASATSVNLFCTVITVICNTVLTPLVNLCLVLSMTSALPGCSSVSPLSTGIKNLSAVLTAFVFSVLGFAVSLQTVISAAGDSYGMRTVRFASGVFIPVIGNMVGEASRTVISAVAKSKAIIGNAGIAALMSIALPPVAVVVLYKIGILLCGAMARMVGCEKEARLLYDVNGIFGILLAVMLGAAIVGILAVTVFVCVGAKV